MSVDRDIKDTLENKGGSISSDTFRRIYLLNIINGFRRGVFGLKRLHKVAYISERESKETRLFEFKKYHHGQYSETLDMIKDQLISLDLVKAIPLSSAQVIRFTLPDEKTIDITTGGNTYVVTDRDIMDFYHDAFTRISPGLMEAVHRTIQEYGYLPEEELIKRCYDFQEFVETEFDEMIFEANLPDRVNTPNLSLDECEELELSLNPKFNSAIAKIIESMEKSRIELGRITTIGTVV